MIKREWNFGHAKATVMSYSSFTPEHLITYTQNNISTTNNNKVIVYVSIIYISQ